ncbi:MAG: hypothetical protein GY761_04850 [Hyphomicrobiales bacterium]|nr:hypothetical protein [Hyphomicrobiales bacterium]
MINEEYALGKNNACIDLMADFVFVTQRTSSKTCDIAARTIARQALNFVKRFPEKIKNIQEFQNSIRDLCECLLMLREEIPGTGEEILIKRDALDILLLISGVIIYPKIETENTPTKTTTKIAQYA